MGALVRCLLLRSSLACFELHWEHVDKTTSSLMIVKSYVVLDSWTSQSLGDVYDVAVIHIFAGVHFSDMWGGPASSVRSEMDVFASIAPIASLRMLLIVCASWSPLLLRICHARCAWLRSHRRWGNILEDCPLIQTLWTFILGAFLF